jgi:hypothetical protein
MQVCDYCHALSASLRPSRFIDDHSTTKNPAEAGFWYYRFSSELRPLFHDRNIAQAATVSATACSLDLVEVHVA